MWRGWRIIVLSGALIATLTLFANIALLLWVDRSASTAEHGVLTLFVGTCSHSTRGFVWSHLTINTIGSLLLAASNATCQFLAAPTRDIIAAVHKEGERGDISIASFRNLRFVPKKRSFMWVVLVFSSVPLHLIYNLVR